VAQLQADLDRASADVRAGRPTGPTGDAAVVRTALSALAGPKSIRPALLILAGVSRARIASDLVLVADDAQIGALADEVRRFAAEGAGPSLADLQWFLDRYAVLAMCTSAEKGSLPPELQSVLALHAGEVARRPDAVLELLKQAGNSDALAQRLVAENLIALEDNSPGARVRAYDWLNAQGRAPAGFDPLGDAKTRRAAIDRSINQGGQR
jgi:hypothetical protein